MAKAKAWRIIEENKTATSCAGASKNGSWRRGAWRGAAARVSNAKT